VSLASTNANVVRDRARASVDAAEHGDPASARHELEQAAGHLAWLVNTLGEAIHSTGTRHDVARRFKELRSEPYTHPDVRSSDSDEP